MKYDLLLAFKRRRAGRKAVDTPAGSCRFSNRMR